MKMLKARESKIVTAILQFFAGYVCQDLFLTCESVVVCKFIVLRYRLIVFRKFSSNIYGMVKCMLTAQVTSRLISIH